MSSPYLISKKCRKHNSPVDGEVCPLCAQEWQEQEKKDDKLAEQIKRLARAGKLRGVSFD
jgi:hypothetical protein